MEGAPESVQANGLLLDTKGSCFLCLKETENSDNSTPKIQEICVRNICKYLNIDASLVLQESLKDRQLTKEEPAQKSNCDYFSVMLCTPCSSLVSSLTAVIRELEMAKMMTHLKLQQFHKILTTSEHEKQLRWEKLKEKMKTSADPVEARLVETLRNQAKEKCSTRLKQLQETSGPKVSLKRLRPKKGVPPPTSSKDAACSGTTSQETPSTTELVPPETPSTNPSSEKNNPEIPKIDVLHRQKIIDLAQNYCKPISGFKYKCTDCDYTISNKLTRQFHLHVINIHPEKLFEKSILKHVEKTELWRIWTLVLYTEMDKIEKSGRLSPEGPRFQCSHCRIEYGHLAKLRPHLVLDHFSFVEQQMLETLSASSITVSKKPPKKKPKKRKQSGISLDDIRRDVKKLLEARTSEPPPKKTKYSHPFECDGCGKRFKLQDTRQRHRKRDCANLNPKPGKAQVPICSVAFGGCGETFRDFFALRLHECKKGRSRKTSPKSRTVPQQSTTNAAKEAPDFTPILPFHPIAIFFEKYKIPTQKSGNGGQCEYKCGICKSSGRAYPDSVISKHLVNTHPEVFFPSKKRATMTPESFKFYCRNVLMDTTTFTQVTSGVTKKAEYLCAFCQLRHRDTVSLRYHLMTEHYYVLEGMVGRAVERDPGQKEQKPELPTISGQETTAMLRDLGTDTETTFESGKMSVQNEVDIVNEEKPDIGEEFLSLIYDADGVPATNGKDVHSEFTAGMSDESEEQSEETWEDTKVGILQAFHSTE